MEKLMYVGIYIQWSRAEKIENWEGWWLYIYLSDWQIYSKMDKPGGY